MITPLQLKTLQTLLNKRFSDREARLDFLSDFFGMEIKSTKDLTEQQAFQLIRFLKEGRVAPAGSFAHFDKNNAQHRTILSLCHELGWVQEENPHWVDLDRLGGWLISKWSPVKKALSQMNKTELSKIIRALKNISNEKTKKEKVPSPQPSA